MTRPRTALLTASALAFATILGGGQPAEAKDSLGIFSGWGAFRDPLVPRCYAIAKAQPSKAMRSRQAYATVASWPKRRVRNQLHVRLSRDLTSGGRIVLRIAGNSFELTGGGGDAWAVDNRSNAAITAAMRSAPTMAVSATDASGARFTDSWRLPGAASAMDAAAIGCARLR